MEKCTVNKTEYQKAFEALKNLLCAVTSKERAEEQAKDWLGTVEAIEFAIQQKQECDARELEYTYFTNLINISYTALNRDIREYFSNNRYIGEPARKIVLRYSCYCFMSEEEEEA